MLALLRVGPRSFRSRRARQAARRHDRRLLLRVELVSDLDRRRVRSAGRLRPVAPPLEPRGRGAVLPDLADRDVRLRPRSEQPPDRRVARWLFLACGGDHRRRRGSSATTGPQRRPSSRPMPTGRSSAPISIPDALYLSTISRAGGLLLGAAFAMIWRPAEVVRGPLRTRGLFDRSAGARRARPDVVVLVVPPGQGVGFLFQGGSSSPESPRSRSSPRSRHQRALTGSARSTPCCSGSVHGRTACICTTGRSIRSSATSPAIR